MRVVNVLLSAYEQLEAVDEVVLLKVLATLASQGEAARQLFLQRGDKCCLIEFVLKVAQGCLDAIDERIEGAFGILQSLCLSKENVNYIWKSRFIDCVMKKLWQLFKGTQRQFAEHYPLILVFTKFLAAYAYNECGRKFLQVTACISIVAQNLL